MTRLCMVCGEVTGPRWHINYLKLCLADSRYRLEAVIRGYREETGACVRKSK